jgi:hypothetical protein
MSISPVGRMGSSEHTFLLEIGGVFRGPLLTAKRGWPLPWLPENQVGGEKGKGQDDGHIADKGNLDITTSRNDIDV